MAFELNRDNSSPGESDPAIHEQSIVEGLRQRDESVFAALVNQYDALMMRVVMLYVSDRAVAEEIVQDTWIGVLQGIQRFEGRSSIKTWIFKILTNRAKRRWEQESRSISFSDLVNDIDPDNEPAVEPERFLPPQHARWPGNWADPPTPWKLAPEDQVLTQETMRMILQAVESLPPRQHAILRLRDIEGWSSQEVCNIFQLTETNQRILLHRARSKVRRALEEYFKAETENDFR